MSPVWKGKRRTYTRGNNFRSKKVRFVCGGMLELQKYWRVRSESLAQGQLFCAYSERAFSCIPGCFSILAAELSVDLRHSFVRETSKGEAQNGEVTGSKKPLRIYIPGAYFF